MEKAASIFLRADIEPQDVRSLWAWMQNEQVTRYLNEGQGVAGELRELLRSVPPMLLRCRFNQRGRFFMVDRREDPVGFVKLQPQAPGCYEIVFAIGEETLWGEGLGSAAVRAAESWAFLEWRARKLTARIYHGNQRSRRVVEKCGFRREQALECLDDYAITFDDYLRRQTERRGRPAGAGGGEGAFTAGGSCGR